LAFRKYSGIGDWIMALSVLKMVNMQHPEIDIHINMKAKNVHLHPNEAKNLPALTEEIIDNFDVKTKGKTYFDNPVADGIDFDFLSGNIRYRKKTGKNFIEGMVRQFSINSGIPLIYDDSVYAQYNNGNIKPDTYKPYVLIQACSKKRHKSPHWKDYGSNNMDIIAGELKKFVNVIQVGDKTDIRLNNATDSHLGSGLHSLHNLMKNCIAFIGLDGMLGVYAAHHKVPHYIIYNGRFNYNWTNFRNRMQLNGNKNGVNKIARIIATKIITGMRDNA
jgi:ADP-heptose:LPS heptosyltransferase